MGTRFWLADPGVVGRRSRGLPPPPREPRGAGVFSGATWIPDSTSVSGGYMRPTEIIFHVSGVFDATAADRLCAKVRGVPTEWRVVVDFSQAREVSILPLGLLAITLCSSGIPRSRVRGLPPHLQRMVAYLGNPAIPREAA